MVIVIELGTGTKYSVDDEYPDLIARLEAAREESRMVKLTLWCG